MGKKKSNTTRGRGTRGSRAHGKDLSDQQRKDAEALKKFSKTKGMKIVRIPAPGENEREAFPSEFSALRRDVKDNFGYRIPRLVPASAGGEAELPRHRGTPKKAKRRGAPQKLPEAYRVLVPGEPDIDAGVDGWVRPENTDDFEILGNRMDVLLATFNRLEAEKKATLVDGEEVQGVFQKLKTRKAESSTLEDQGSGVVERVESKAESVTLRDTLIASPAISRAIQRLIEDGLVVEARQALEAAMEPLGREYESIFRGSDTHAKVTSMIPHVGSGHFHFDTWVHSTYLTEAEIGVAGEVVPVRFWDGRATCHHGPGPGVTFWTRHLDTLGDLAELAKTEPEAAERAGYTKMLCDQAVAGCQKRAKDAYKKASEEKTKVEANGGTYDKWIRPADDYARDIRITRAIDRIIAKAIGDLGLDKDYVAIGRVEYRQHLIEAYKAGNTGIRMHTPEDLEQVAKVAARAEQRVREAEKVNQKVLAETKREKEAVQRLKDESAILVKKVEAEKQSLKLEAEGLKQRTMVSALGEVFKGFFPNRKPSSVDEMGLTKEILQKLGDFVRGGFQSALQSLFPDRRLQARSSKEMVAELKAAAVDFKIEALQEAKEEAVATVLGRKLEVLKNKGLEPVAELSAEIRRLQESEALLRTVATLKVPPKGAAAKVVADAVNLLATHDAARGRSAEMSQDERPLGGL